MSKTISAGRAPKILIENVDGDLSLVGWEGEDILLKGDEDEMTFKQDGEEVRISCNDDLSLRVPKGSSISIKRIGGDASIKGILGGVELKEAGGDLSIRDVMDISIDVVDADLSLRGAKGNVFVKSAGADVSIREVDGNISLQSVADDLALRDARGNVSANVSEDVVLYINPSPGVNISVTAGEDILLVMPPKANATLDLNGDEIEVEWKGVENEEEAASREIVLGDGSALISLKAGGDIRVTNQANAGDSAEDFGNFAGMGMDWSGFGDRISKHVEQVTKRATKNAEEAAKRAERASKRGAFLKVGRWNWDVTPKGPQISSTPPVSDEERLEILKMLQDKIISAEDAEKLLAALEGEA